MTALALQKFSLKFPITSGLPDAPTVFKIFDSWIPDKLEIFIDVADYSHVTDGPQTALIGHYADLVLDNTDNKPGFVYRQKRTLENKFEKTLTTAIGRLQSYTDLLEKNTALTPRVTLDKTKIELTFNDRLLAPNTQAACDKITLLITGALQKIPNMKKAKLASVELNKSTRLTVLIALPS